MHFNTTLAQAVDTADALVDEWQQLRSSTADAQPGRLEELALVQLESQIIDVFGSVRYRRQQEEDKQQQERQTKLDDEQRDQEAAATRERLRLLTEPSAQVTEEQGDRLSIDIDAPLSCGRHISVNNAAPCARPAGHGGAHQTLADLTA